MHTLEMYKNFTIKIWNNKLQEISSDPPNVVVQFVLCKKNMLMLFL